MKKVLVCVLSLVLIVCSFVGCGNKEEADYPTKPIQMIVGYAAGGGTDTLARTAAQYVD